MMDGAETTLKDERVFTAPLRDHGRGAPRPGLESGPSVLVVDDEAAVRDIVRRMLERGGCRVAGEAEDGAGAVALLDRLEPDVVVMDYEMRDVNGIDATRMIKEKNPAVKVVLLTGRPSPSLVLAGQRAGASNFVIKPPEMRQLTAVVRYAAGYR